jgi:hypothetical protein
MGHVLIATQNINAKSLLCEYVGELSHMDAAVEPRVEDEQICFGEPLNGYQQVISSKRFANESRYFATIPIEKGDDANCEAHNMMIDGVPRIFIYSVTDIEEGDILYLDYRGALPTDGFIYIKNKKELLNHHEGQENEQPKAVQREPEEGEIMEEEKKEPFTPLLFLMKRNFTSHLEQSGVSLQDTLLKEPNFKR